MDAKDQETCALATAMRRYREAVSMAFGHNYANDPYLIAKIMEAEAAHLLAGEVKALREVLSEGTGAVTINIERPT